MPRRHRLLCGLAASAVLLSGCSGGSQHAAPEPTQDASQGPRTQAGGAAGSSSAVPLLRGLDVCSLVTPEQVRLAVGQVGEPTTRALTRIAGYGALVDQCGFGVSFDSFTFVVGVGLAPATRKDLTGMPGAPVAGIGDAARATDRGRFTTVSFLKGATLVQVRADKSDAGSRTAQVAAVARTIAGAVPADPPETDAQTSGVCADVDPKVIEGVLGAPAAVSRTLLYKDRSAACSWATGVQDARTLSLGVYSNRQAGPFFADQKVYEKSHDVPGVTGDAFTTPGTAYVVAEDGQAIAVTGTFPPKVGRDQPLPVTPQLTALLGHAVDLMQ